GDWLVARPNAPITVIKQRIPKEIDHESSCRHPPRPQNLLLIGESFRGCKGLLVLCDEFETFEIFLGSALGTDKNHGNVIVRRNVAKAGGSRGTRNSVT